MAIFKEKMNRALSKRHLLTRKTRWTQLDENAAMFFKRRRRGELFRSLLNSAHEASRDFCYEYSKNLIEELEAPEPSPFAASGKPNPLGLNIDWAERMLGSAAARDLRMLTWMMMLRRKIVVIDTLHYSKTDRRMMANDFDEIYWLWHDLVRSDTKPPNLVVAIQKEMFQGDSSLTRWRRLNSDHCSMKGCLKRTCFVLEPHLPSLEML